MHVIHHYHHVGYGDGISGTSYHGVGGVAPWLSQAMPDACVLTLYSMCVYTNRCSVYIYMHTIYVGYMHISLTVRPAPRHLCGGKMSSRPFCTVCGVYTTELPWLIQRPFFEVHHVAGEVWHLGLVV